MFGEWKVQILHTPGRTYQRVYLYKNSREGTEFLTHSGPMHYTEGAQYKDDEVYFVEMDDEQLQAFAQTLSEKGIKTNKDSVAEGKLAATEKHLEDMRSLVFKGKK